MAKRRSRIRRSKSRKHNSRHRKSARRLTRKRQHHNSRKYYRGGSRCETTAGAATGACFPNDGLLNGPYGFIPVNKTIGIYPAQI